MQHDDDDAFSPLGLRPASVDDTSFLISLFASTRSDELAALASDHSLLEAFISMQFNAQTSQYNMSYPQADHSIILWNGAPIGRMLIDKGANEFTLVDIALLPAHRDGGIGTGLIQDLQRQAVAAAKPIRLHVFCSSAAKRLYERLGFSQIGADAAYLEMMWVPPVS